MKKNRVIVADDDVDAADMLAMLLGWELEACVSAAYDGGSAVSLALAKQPTAVILDLNMPVLSGAEAARAIRTSPLDPKPILIAVSGNVGWLPADELSALFDHVLSKPVDLRHVLEILTTPRISPDLPPRSA